MWDEEAAKAKERKVEGGKKAGRGRPQQVPQQVAEPIDNDTRARLARDYGTNHHYVGTAKRIKDEDPETFEKRRTGSRG